MPPPSPFARATPGAYVLAAALPLLFLHERYTPGVAFPVGATDVELRLTDVAIAAVVAAAALAWRRGGPGRLAAGRWVWISTAALVALVLASVAWGQLRTEDFLLGRSTVSALKFAEYALLAPAAALLLRTRRDLVPPAVVLVAWSALATIVGALQFLGLLGDLDDTPAGRRKPSFLGYHDFAALAAATLLLAVLVLALRDADRRTRILGWVAAASGALGLALAGSIAAAGGVLAGAVVVLAFLRPAARRTLLAAGVVVVALAATAAIRSGDVADFASFLDVEQRAESEDIETYSHRTVLAYIGLRIAVDHPFLGVGWQGSSVPSSFEPYLDDARARFPNVAEEALPSPEHRWGVQNGYIQAAADTGVGGLAALLAVLVTAGLAAWRGARRGSLAALAALGWLLVAAAELAALGLPAGVPIWALVWLAVGLSVGSPAMREGEA